MTIITFPLFNDPIPHVTKLWSCISRNANSGTLYLFLEHLNINISTILEKALTDGQLLQNGHQHNGPHICFQRKCNNQKKKEKQNN